MSKKVNINVLFPEEEMDNQWIIDLIACMRFACHKVIGDQFQFGIIAGDPQELSNNTKLDDDFFITILGSKSNDSEHFQESLSVLCSYLFQDNQKPFFFSRLFKVLMKPNSGILQPDKLKPDLGYEFFDYSFSGKETKLYNLNTQDIKVWSVVLDIIYDLKQAIHFIQEESEKSKFAYLANCSVDQKAYHNDIRRELQHFNFKVLPILELPEETEPMKAVIESSLEHCSLIVQIVGERYGKVKPGDNISIFEKENNIIQEYLKDHPEKFRLIWKPSDLKLSDMRQNLYLKRLMKDGTSRNSKIIDASLDEFKDTISGNLKTPESILNDTANPSSIYLMCRLSDDTTQLEHTAKQLNISILKEYEAENGFMYLSHLENLKKFPNLAIFYVDDSLSWLKSKLGDIIKVIGLGRDIKLKSLAIIGNKEPDIEEYVKWLPDIKFYNISDNEALGNFIQKCNI
jgi:hypothetical protein